MLVLRVVASSAPRVEYCLQHIKDRVWSDSNPQSRWPALHSRCKGQAVPFYAVYSHDPFLIHTIGDLRHG